MTRHMPDPTPVNLPAGLLRALIDGDLPPFRDLRLLRMHFPTGRAPHAVLHADGQTLHAEWIGAEVTARAATEAARLAQLGQPADLRADPATGFLLRRPGMDAKLPGLRLLTDAALAQDCLAGLGLTGPFQIDLAAHRLGRRAVLRIRHAKGLAYARLRSPTASAGQSATARHQALWSALEGAPRLRLPAPLGTDAALGLSLYSALPGTPLRLHGLRGFAGIEATAQAIATLQGVATDAPLWTAEDEAALLTRWLDRIAVALPELWPQLWAQVAAQVAALRHIPPMAPVACHRDLHEGQILLYRGVAGLLDFDTLSRGDPALDIGNLQAHLDLAGLRQGRSFAAYATALERVFPHVPRSRITVWRGAARLRLAMIWAFSAEPCAHLHALTEAPE